MMNRKSYKDLIQFNSFQERFEYLKCDGSVCDITFGGHRYLNQFLYNSKEWKEIRDKVIIRDDGFDLAHKDYPIIGNIYVHHINPIKIEDVLERKQCIFDLNNLISVSFQTHNAIHYGSSESLRSDLIVRRPNDTCPWKE